MRATTAVARWTWGRDLGGDSGAEAGVGPCLRKLFTAHEVLGRHRLMVGIPKVSVSVHEAGERNSYLFRGEIELRAVGSPLETAQEAAQRVHEAMSPGETGSVYAHIDGPGDVALGDAYRSEPGLFRLGGSALLGYVGVDLVTRTDFWLPYDLKGRPQPQVHAANAPRLSAALRDLAEALDSDTDPDDPTSFARPNETGAENFLGEDGNALDVWSSCELPARYDVFTHAPGFDRIGYRRTAEAEVTCVPIRSDDGTLFGHLWASEPENAASFEPEDIDDERTYHAGLLWLDRLRAAHDRGLSPAEALTELSVHRPDPDAGCADASGTHITVLRELRDQGTRPEYSGHEQGVGVAVGHEVMERDVVDGRGRDLTDRL
ncbi:hypothetical protein [Streptomyces galbus]|uniref:Uncharacterized protein n=1 Tax=Streptomyces galbus TaxID=33898 RepID=A0A4U5WAA6_STRGB|nr:hypothetical protein [Streptomyces galbus]TKS98021.1 hypothetical protein E4U92_32095 [Streptomyces galbus]